MCITAFLCNRQHFQKKLQAAQFYQRHCFFIKKKLRVRMKYSIYILNFMHSEQKKITRKTLIMILLHSNASSFHTHTKKICVFTQNILDSGKWLWCCNFAEYRNEAKKKVELWAEVLLYWYYKGEQKKAVFLCG